MNTKYFSSLLPQLRLRSQQASISYLGFSNVALRRHLADLFGQPLGESGSLLADPTFEAVFGWQASKDSMQTLKQQGILHTKLVEVMNNPPQELREDYRFALERSPYTHQLEAWKILSNPQPQSVIVSSGTGSGKTECFMVPILNRLLQQQLVNNKQLIGVRALFIYPLNALINSQRDRLRAWTDGFGDKIRFCLYNGNTPETVPAHHQKQQPSEVIDRKTLRQAPPPILVTNATMLEYMLVRTIDKPIIDQSQGNLEWIVLDEAHSYIGSQAAELALLIRRVLHAFAVKPEQVRFVATSATIGDPSGEAGQQLKQFLADVAGIDTTQVHLVSGQREIPSLPKLSLNNTQTLEQLWGLENEDQRYQALLQHSQARLLRDCFTHDPRKTIARLSELTQASGIKDQAELLGWLDLLTATRDSDEQAFLPLRAHIFHQTILGLWACADHNCSAKDGSALNAPEWPFGKLYLTPRQRCECGSPVYTLVSCNDCGEIYLLANIDIQGKITQLTEIYFNQDDFQLNEEPPESEDEETPNTVRDNLISSNRFLICDHNIKSAVETLIDKHTLKLIDEPTNNSLLLYAYEPENDSCLACGATQKKTRREPIWRFGRISAPFLLSNILPTLLEFAPDGKHPADHPYRGRRLLSFNDSRQGTARIAATLQQSSERNRVRALVYHITLQNSLANSDQLTNLKDKIDILSTAFIKSPSTRLSVRLDQIKAEFAQLSTPQAISFDKLASQLTQQGQDFERMLELYKRYAPAMFSMPTGPMKLARMFLVREFARRPKRQNSLETMGLVAVTYPALQGINSVPQSVKEVSAFTLEEWKAFLKLSLDFFVRSGGSLFIDKNWKNQLGIPYSHTFLISSEREERSKNQRRWPSAQRSSLGRLVRLLAYVLNADTKTAIGIDRIDTVLREAWTILSTKILQINNDGYILPLNQLAFTPISNAWVCPFTRRFLDTTLRGVSPYLPLHSKPNQANCSPVQLPLYPNPFGNGEPDLQHIQTARAWIAEQPVINQQREEGLWSDLNNRVIELAPYFITAEHSAQLDSKTLERYENKFKAGDINLLSCSTTMEMGIDIGGISMVAMNNVPPHPANYLQRAGRAGRRQEARSISTTLCKANPHDQAAFNNSRWAFDATLPAPYVSLNSPVIVQRHVNSFLLSAFLVERFNQNGNNEEDRSKLTCGWFFLTNLEQSDANSPVQHFIAWCNAFNSQDTSKQHLVDGLQQITLRSVFAGRSANSLTADSAQGMEAAFQPWSNEWDGLQQQWQEVVNAAETDPARRAMEIQRGRMSGEYLLRELATRGFLPGYGFPNHIASFDNLTISRLGNNHSKKREDNYYQRRELASRGLVTALREYAPGADLVMDGLVYRSAGITLNWHIPASEEDVSEAQYIRFAWRCNQCGASGSSAQLETAKYCSHCGVESTTCQFLEPSGFAVDFCEEPTNNLSPQQLIPAEKPWIHTNGEWISLPNPKLGRLRSSVRGHIFHQSNGLHNKGYAVCLKCGRAMSVMPDGQIPAEMTGHRKLRKDEWCDGHHNEYSIKRLTLGYETHTDILELQLKTLDGLWLKDKVTAQTLAVALRDALAECLGIQASELGCDTKPARLDTASTPHSILIYDHFAAGYASSAERYIKPMFELAAKRLNCSANCDSACPQCVLSFEQRFAADTLDRHKAVELLNTNWLNSLELPQTLQYFGSNSKIEYVPLEQALWRAVRLIPNAYIRLLVSDTTHDWDIGESPIRHLAYALAHQGYSVQLLLPSSIVLESIEERHLLASLADCPNLYIIYPVPNIANQTSEYLVAEVGNAEQYIQWKVSDKEAINFAASWGKPNDGVLVQGQFQQPSSLEVGPAVSAQQLRPVPLDNGDRELPINNELDGNLNGFGNRFWELLIKQHAATQRLLQTSNAQLRSIQYQDRYLFTPQAAALLYQVLIALKQLLGQRWNQPTITVTTSHEHDIRTKNANFTPRQAWHDWSNTHDRDHALEELLGATVNSRPKHDTPHSRLLVLEFDGCQLSLRLDQGLAYWSSKLVNNRDNWQFAFNAYPAQQAYAIKQLSGQVRGDKHATVVFASVR